MPVVNSDDDLFLMYQLAGGFGERPTNLLHFDHAIHPWLGYILSGLFARFPHFNWYTWFFILCQFFSWTLIGRVLLSSFKKKTGVFVFFLLFVLAGVNGLQSLNMTSTSWLLSISAMAFLFYFPDALIRCFILLLLAGSIRLQIPLIVVTLFIPIQWVNKKRLPWKPVFFLAGFASILFLLNLGQKRYYEKNIPGWDKAESRRQDLFYSFNRPKDLEKDQSLIFQDNIEKAFFERVFLYDEHIPSDDQLAKIARAGTRIRDLTQQEDIDELYWTWAAWRHYLLYLGIMALIVWQQKKLILLLRRSWLPISGMIAFYIFLFLFFKLTAAFFMGILLMMALQFILLWPSGKSGSARISYMPLLFLLPMAWSISRSWQVDKVNRKEYRQFACAARELAADRSHLFIATGDVLPLNYFKFNALPGDFPLDNFIYKERVLTRCYLPAFKKYGLTENLFQNLHSPILKFAGPYFPELIMKAFKTGDSIQFSEPDKAFKCIEVRSVLVK